MEHFICPFVACHQLPSGAGCSNNDKLKPGLVENHETKFGASLKYVGILFSLT